jgi:hypothetical protein
MEQQVDLQANHEMPVRVRDLGKAELIRVRGSVKNREARMIDPLADAMSEDYRDGLLTGFHDCGVHVLQKTIFTEADLERHTSDCKNVEWCGGYFVGYNERLRRYRQWQVEHAGIEQH